MKIDRIHIENFGKLSDFTLDLNEKVNTVLEENGWGKSTLASFIRIMFYGTSGDRQRKNIRENDRSLYKPWNGKAFGGSIEFETSKGSFILTRTFSDSGKGDTFDLRDKKTGLTSTAYDPDTMGESIFGLDLESYKKTSYIGHDNIKYSGAGSEIGSRVTSTGQSEDIAKYDMAQDILNSYLNSNSPKKKTGYLYGLKAEISALEENSKRKENITERLSGEKETLKGLSANEQELKTEKKEKEELLSKLSEVGEKIRNKRALADKQQELSKREEKRAEILSRLGGKEPDEELLTAAGNRISELEKLSVRLEENENKGAGERLIRLKLKYGENAPDSTEINVKIEEAGRAKELVHKINAQTERIEEEKRALNEQQVRNEQAEEVLKAVKADKVKSAGAMIAVGACLMVAFIGSAAFWFFVKRQTGDILFLIIALILLIAGVIFMLFGIVKRVKASEIRPSDDLQHALLSFNDRIETLKADLKNLEDELTEKESGLKLFLGSFGIDYFRQDAEQALYALKKDASDYREAIEEEKVRCLEKEELIRRGEEISQKLFSDFESLGRPLDRKLSFPGVYGSLKKSLSDIGSDLQELRFATDEAVKAKALYEEYREKYADLLTEDIPDEEEAKKKSDDTKTRISEIAGELELLSAKMNVIARNIDDAERELEEIKASDEKLEALKEEYSEKEHKYGIVEKTKELLTKAKDSLIARYMAPLMCSFERYYGILGEGERSLNSGEFLIDTNLEIRKKEFGTFRDVVTLSDGSGDLIGLCMRAAFLDVMYKDEKPVVVMDDPFSNFDEENLKWGRGFLEQLSKDYQVIYLTCHPDRVFKMQ